MAVTLNGRQKGPELAPGPFNAHVAASDLAIHALQHAPCAPLRRGRLLLVAELDLDRVAVQRHIVGSRSHSHHAAQGRLENGVIAIGQTAPANTTVKPCLLAIRVAEGRVQADPPIRDRVILGIAVVVSVDILPLLRADGTGVRALIEGHFGVRLVTRLKRPVLDPNPVLAVHRSGRHRPLPRNGNPGTSRICLFIKYNSPGWVLELVVDIVSLNRS